MSGNTIGTIFKVTTWGESHGDSIGCIVDGCPSGITIDTDFINNECSRRAPGQSNLTTPRKESDAVRIMSGVYNGVSTGTPIAIMIENTNVKSVDYDNLKDLFRPGHADYSYHSKYGTRDHRGGGRSSARTTASIVAAGAIAKTILSKIHGFEINAYVKKVYNISTNINPLSVTREMVESNAIRCPDLLVAEEMIELIESIKEQKNSVGGVIECVIKNPPIGMGEPVFDKLDADLAKAMLSINATKGFEIGEGFDVIKLKGSENNDIFTILNGKVTTKTNHSGGIIGGISTGMPIIFRVAFKPTPTIGLSQETIDIDGNMISIEATGRHDPCVLPRAVAIVEAMAAIILCDYYLLDTIKRGTR